MSKENPRIDTVCFTRLMTVKDVCEVLNVSRPTLRRLADNGLPPVKMPGRAVRYEPAIVKKFIENSRHQPLG